MNHHETEKDGYFFKAASIGLDVFLDHDTIVCHLCYLTL